MKKSIIVTLILASVLSITFIKCKREVSKEQTTSNSSNQTALPFKELGFITPTALPNSILKIENKAELYTKYNKNNKYSANFAELNNKELSGFIRTLTSYSIEPLTFVMYLNTELKPNQTITFDNITALSFYLNNKGNIFHQLYIKENNKLIIREDYSIDANLATSNHMTFLLNNIIPSKLNSISYLSIRNKDVSSKVNNFHDDFLLKESTFYKNWLKENYSDNKTFYKAPPKGGGGGPADKGCGSTPGCQVGFSWDVCSQSIYSNAYVCGALEETCNDRASYKLLTESHNYDQTALINAFDFQLHYNLRNTLLIGSPVGEKYCHYFYAISNIMSANTSLSFAYDCFLALPEMNSAILKLLSPSGHENEILVNNAFAQKLKTIITNLRQVSQNNDFIAMLDDIENDLDYYTNKTLNEVLAVFAH